MHNIIGQSFLAQCYVIDTNILMLKIILIKYVYTTKGLNFKGNNPRSKYRIQVVNKLKAIKQPKDLC